MRSAPLGQPPPRGSRDGGHPHLVDRPTAGCHEAVAGFVAGVLGDDGFVEDLERFLADHHRLVEAGRATSLAQTALLLTRPGVPDLYQGSELWDYGLVDPDNRRPVDYGQRRELLAELSDADAAEARRHDDDGGSKVWFIARVVDHRRRHPGRYTSERYQALRATGARAGHAVAFCRGDLAVVVPRLVLGLAADWDDTAVTLPEGRWRDVLSDATHGGGSRPVTDLLAALPVALLSREDE